MLNSFRGTITKKAIQRKNGKSNVKNRTSWKMFQHIFHKRFLSLVLTISFHKSFQSLLCMWGWLGECSPLIVWWDRWMFRILLIVGGSNKIESLPLFPWFFFFFTFEHESGVSFLQTFCTLRKCVKLPHNYKYIEKELLVAIVIADLQIST